MQTKPTEVSRPPDASLTFWRYFLPFWVAFGVVKILQIFFYPDPYLISDTGEYLWSAHTLRVNPYKPFGYSLFLAGCRFVLPFPLGVAILQSLLKLGATTLLGVVLRRYFEVPRGIVLAVCVLIGLDPLALFLDHHLLADSLFISAAVTGLAAVVAYSRCPAWGWLMVAIVSMTIATITRFVGLVYPGLLLAVVLLYPGRAKLARVAVVVGATVGVLAGIATLNQQEFGVFRFTTFDGWALYGNIGGLLEIDAEAVAAQRDPESRLLHAYFASFPPETYRSHHPDWHRWDPRSPAKQLLYGFHQQSDGGTGNVTTAAHNFVTRFDRLARPPSTSAQHLYHRYLRERGSGDPDRQPYHQAFVLVNELLRRFDQDFLRENGGRYLTRFYLDSLAGVFAPRDLLNGGTYRERWEADQAVEVFWPGTDSTRWRPRMGDVAGAFGGWYRWYMSVEWLLAVVLLGSCLACRPPRPLPVWKRLSALGALLFAFAVAYGAAVAYSHPTETRYLGPILPFVIVSGCLCGVRPFVPWLNVGRVLSFRWTPARRWAVAIAGLLVVAFVVIRAGSVTAEAGRDRTDDRARAWLLDRARPGALVAVEGPGRVRMWARDPRMAERLRVVSVSPTVLAAGSDESDDQTRLFADFDYMVLGADVAGPGSSAGGHDTASTVRRRALDDAWRPAIVFRSDSLRGPTVWVIQNRSDVVRGVDSDPHRFDALAGAPQHEVWEFLGELGDAYLAGGEGERALEVYAAATKLCPDNEMGFYNYGALAIELGRHDEAIPALERAIALRGDRAESHNNLGIARAETGDLDGAIEAIEVAIRLDPTHRNAPRNLEVVREMKRTQTSPAQEP